MWFNLYVSEVIRMDRLLSIVLGVMIGLIIASEITKLMDKLEERIKNKVKSKIEDYKEKKRKEKLYKISDIVKFPYGTKFENINSGSIYTMEQQLKIIKSNGEYDYPAIGRDTFYEDYRIVE